MSDAPREIQPHNMAELTALVDALPDELKENGKNFLEGFVDAQLALYGQNRFAFGLYDMEAAEDMAIDNATSAAAARFGLQKVRPDEQPH